MTRFEEVRDLVSDQLGVPVFAIKPESNFSDLGADSMDMNYMRIDFEELAGGEIPESEFHRMTTVQDVLNYLNDSRSHAS